MNQIQIFIGWWFHCKMWYWDGSYVTADSVMLGTELDVEIRKISFQSYSFLMEKQAYNMVVPNYGPLSD